MLLRVHSSATGDVLKDRAVSKQNSFNSGLVRRCDGVGYKLLFPDKKDVERNFTSSFHYEDSKKNLANSIQA